MPIKKSRIIIHLNIDFDVLPDKHNLWKFILHDINKVFNDKYPKRYVKIRNVKIHYPDNDKDVSL